MNEETITTHEIKNNRLVSLDILKILATFFIIIHHVSKYGGFYDNATGLTLFILQVANALFLPSVNIFVYISAYLIIRKGKTSLKNYLYIYAQTVFYALFTYIIVCLMNHNTFSINTTIKCFLPITFSSFWFCREYLLFYIVSPLLLKIVQNLNKKEFTITIAIILGILLYSNLLKIAILPLNSGFTFIWFIALFLLAGYQFKFGFFFKKYIFALTFAITSIFSIMIIQQKGMTVNYTYFITTLQTISLFNILYDIKINSKICTKILSYISTCTLGIYLLHDGDFIRSILYKNILQTNKFLNKNLLLYWFLFIILIFAIGLIVETLRKTILKLGRVLIKKIQQHKSSKTKDSILQSNNNMEITTKNNDK